MADALLLRDPDAVARAIEMFLFEHVARTSGGVVALSGGLDSALVLALAVRALGSERVVGLLMPDGETTPNPDMEDARAWSQKLNVDTHEIDLAPLLQPLRRTPAGDFASNPIGFGNIKARLRMVLCYAVANQQNKLVLGTGNRSELLLGYFTKFGDGGADLLPIGGLYKTQVRQLARHLRLPTVLLNKPPSAGLWEGQSDEKELGAPYARIDDILVRLVERRHPPAEVAASLGVDERLVIRLQQRIDAHLHKRQPPPVAVVG